MQKPSGLGIWSRTNVMDKQELVDLAKNVERLGYQTLWYPESLSYEALSVAGYLLSHTEKLIVASGIANIYARDAVTAAQGHDSLNRLYDNRFLMGLGVSHVPLVEGARGHSYGKPVATMRKYLGDIISAKIDPTIKIDDRAIVLAALGPKMLELASASTKGALPYCVTPDHTIEARKIMGPEPWLCVEQKICFTNEEGTARTIAQEQMAPYMAMTNYRNNWFRLGFTEEEVTGNAAPRFLDAMVVWGKEQVINDCIDAHFKAGADQVVLQAFRPDGKSGSDPKALEAFAPNG
ncbi:MAG: TIGR03620 family F420-dependent LLM class oxidoreductase [Rhodospirillaceae bacterium]|nr:TIGR03620 family F420-dependent LLM class oxidoreductase [Rhodospirillaceae bacterium]MBT5912624.1 TIGR03620 family F420-dependent LLM class oxidoreductase [Rhodospirillaceae bacterium]MDC1442630.1 LLM class flavin-dependent oxidoreductase [Rhodospirillaceae bacterium]